MDRNFVPRVTDNPSQAVRRSIYKTPKTTLSLLQLWSSELPLFGVGLMVSALIIGLILIILWSTLVEGLPRLGGAVSLINYAEVLLYPVTPQAALNTILLGIGTVVINLIFAVPMAWLLHRTNVPYKNLFITLAFLHILIPGFLKAIGWIILLSPEIGLANQILRTFISVKAGPLSIYNLPFIMFLQGMALTPLMFFMISGAFLSIDPAFEESAETTGASKLNCLRRITFPLVLPAILAALIYCFMTSVSMFEYAALLGAPHRIHVFSTLMYSALNPQVGIPNYGIAGVYGLLLLIPALIALFLYQRVLRLSHRYATVTGKGYRPKLMDIGKWKWLGVFFIGLFFFMDMVLPLLGMIWVSFLPHIQLPSMGALASATLNGYRSAMELLTTGDILANTFLLIVSVGIGVALISIIISWIVLRSRLPGKYILDTIAMLPHAVPRVAFAFAIAFVGLIFVKQIPLYGSLTSIIFCHLMAWLAFGTRTVNGALIQIHRDLEDAVLVCGGSRLSAIRRVYIPLLSRTIAYVTIWTTLLSYREVTMALFLQSPKSTVLSTAIWLRWQNADTSTAAALGTIMIVVMGFIITVLLKVKPQIFSGQREI